MGLKQYKIEQTNDEKVKVLDENTHKEKGNIDREEGIEKGVLLEAVQLWIINPKTKEVLMQRRAKDKENDPNMIDVSAAGLVHSNEIPEQAVLREAFEETKAIPMDVYNTLEKVMEVEIDLKKFYRKGKYITHEYISLLDKPIEYFERQETEVAELFWLDYEKVKKMIREKHPDMRIPYNEDAKKLFEKIDEIIYQRQEGLQSEIKEK